MDINEEKNASIATSLNTEVQWNNCSLGFNAWCQWEKIPQSDLVTSAWNGAGFTDGRFFAWKVFAFLYLFVDNIWSWSLDDNNDWLIYLTHWGMLITLTYFSFSLYCCYVHYKTPVPSHDANRTNAATLGEQSIKNYFPFKMAQITFEMSLPIQWIVVLMYWITVYVPGTSKGVDLYRDINAHGMNLVFLLIDLSLNNMHFYDRHSLVTIVMGIAYSILNAIWTLMKWYIYSILTWTSIFSVIIVLVLLGFVVLLHKFCRKCCEWRDHVATPLIERDNATSPIAISVSSNLQNGSESGDKGDESFTALSPKSSWYKEMKKREDAKDGGETAHVVVHVDEVGTLIREE